MQPAYRITADGDDITAKLQSQLMQIRWVDESAGTADRLEIKLDDTNNALILPERNAVLRLAIGYKGKLVDVGAFSVTEFADQDAPSIITIICNTLTASVALKSTKNRLWEATTLGNVVATIAESHGLNYTVAATVADIEIEREEQKDQSDKAFLQALGKKYNCPPKYVDNRILMIPRAEAKTASGAALTPLVINRNQCFSNSGRSGVISGTKKVKAKWRNINDNKALFVTVGEGSPSTTLKTVFTSESEAISAATAELVRLARGNQTRNITLDGNPEALAETPVTLAGFRHNLATNWIIDRAEHTYTPSNGYTMQLQLGVPINRF